MLGIHWARDFEPNTRAASEAAQPEAAQPLARARRSPNMTYHGGVIMPSSNTKAIFWGTSWGKLLRRQDHRHGLLVHGLQ